MGQQLLSHFPLGTLYPRGDWLCVQAHHCPPDHAYNMEIALLLRSCCVLYLAKSEDEEALPCVQGAWGGRALLCCALQPREADENGGRIHQ